MKLCRRASSSIPEQTREFSKNRPTKASSAFNKENISTVDSCDLCDLTLFVCRSSGAQVFGFA